MNTFNLNRFLVARQLTGTGGEEMKRLLTIGTVLVLVLAFFASGVGLAPSFAKVTDTVPGGNIQYFSSGHINLTVPIANTGFPFSKLAIKATHFEDSTYGSYDQMTIYFDLGSLGLVPLTVVTTSQDAADFAKLAWKNTPIYIPNLLNNIVKVSSEDLKVERHGNSISAIFNPSNMITLNWPISPGSHTLIPLNLPAFHMEFNKYGGSEHSTFISLALKPYSGYTLKNDIMGFNSDSAFTCTAWNMYGAAGTSGFIVMHGIQIWTPP
jgi:hypothetical protein